VQATLRLAHICAAQGDFSKAHDLLITMEARIQNPVQLPEIQNARARISMQTNPASSLDWWTRLISEQNRNTFHLQKEQEVFTLARLRIVEGNPGEALALLAPWKADFTDNGRTRSRVEGSLLKAIAYQSDSDLPRAISALIEALTLGQSKGFRRLFLDEGVRLAALLRAALPSIQNRTLNLFASTLLHLLPADSNASLPVSDSRVQIEPLSQQELRVLRLLVAGMSNAEIASELVVSNNTVKTHVKSIYRKLNVKSRDEAREVARELKLLSS
jgi:LuxR family maltose regulon positive regulatory protein